MAETGLPYFSLPQHLLQEALPDLQLHLPCSTFPLPGLAHTLWVSHLLCTPGGRAMPLPSLLLTCSEKVR